MDKKSLSWFQGTELNSSWKSQADSPEESIAGLWQLAKVSIGDRNFRLGKAAWLERLSWFSEVP